MLADLFSGNEKYETAPLKQTVKTAILLLMAVTECIKRFGGPKDLLFYFQSTSLNKLNIITTDELATVIDCRSYSKFHHSFSSKSATEYTTGASKLSEAVQVNTIQRFASLCRKKDFRFVQQAQAFEMYTCLIRDLDEEKKFFWFIDQTKWLVNMHTLRDSLLRGASFGKEFMQNTKNDDIILRSLLDSFWHLFPS